MRSFIRLLLFCVLLLAGVPVLHASLSKTRVGNFFPLAADPCPEVALQVPELRLDNPWLYGEVVSGSTLWTNFDPDGLKTKDDYRKDIRRYIAEGRCQQRDLSDKLKRGEISQDDYNWQSRDIDLQQHEKVQDAARAMRKIEATARDIEQSTRSATGSVDGEKLDDEDSVYKEFRALHTAMSFWPAGAGAAEHASHGEYGAAAKSFGIEVAITMVGGKLLKAVGGKVAPKLADDVIHVAPNGVAFPPGPKYKIPSHYIENAHRPGSYGVMENGKFVEKLRIDAATPPGKKGPGYGHYHLNGEGTHYSPRPGELDPGFN